MEAGVPELTTKGREALKNSPPDLTALCRNILVQIDGKRSLEEIRQIFRGLKGLDEAIQRLAAGGFIRGSEDCADRIKAMAVQMLGVKAPTLIKKIEELHAKYGEQCWSHLDELDKLARMFYGAVIADELKSEIAKILNEAGK